MNEKRKFTTGAVITAATGKMCCDIDELYDILGWLVGESLMTHQLPGASRAVEADIKRQFPWMADLDTASVNPDNVHAWYDGITAIHGTHTSVCRPESVDWLQGNALQDLRDLAGDKPVVVVNIGPDSPPAAHTQGAKP